MILRVADDEALRGVEHAQPLRHAVDGGVYLLIFSAQTPDQQVTSQNHRKLGNERGEDGVENRFGNGGNNRRGPAGSEDSQRAETRHKRDEPGKQDQPPAALKIEGEKGFKHVPSAHRPYGIFQPVFLQLIIRFRAERGAVFSAVLYVR